MLLARHIALCYTQTEMAVAKFNLCVLHWGANLASAMQNAMVVKRKPPEIAPLACLHGNLSQIV